MKKSCKDVYGLEFDDLKEKSSKRKLTNMKMYNKNHQEKVKIYKKVYREKHPERVKDSKNKYIKEVNEINSHFIDEDYQKVCDGCNLIFTTDSIYYHISHSLKCKKVYGKNWDKMLEKRKNEKRKEINSQYYDNNTKEILQVRKEYYEKNKEDIIDLINKKKQKSRRELIEKEDRYQFSTFLYKLDIEPKKYWQEFLAQCTSYKRNINSMKRHCTNSFRDILLRLISIEHEIDDFVKKLKSEVDEKVNKFKKAKFEESQSTICEYNLFRFQDISIIGQKKWREEKDIELRNMAKEINFKDFKCSFCVILNKPCPDCFLEIIDKE